MDAQLRIVREPLSRADLAAAVFPGFEDMVKAVVDVSRQVMAIGGQMHADEESLLLEDGSAQSDVWGINLYLDQHGTNAIEFDSLINLRPGQNNRSRSVDDPALRGRITRIVQHLVPEL